MMRLMKLEHRFVSGVPRELEPGVLYISMEYATAMHSCCCGCGEQVVTPLSPMDWKLTYDGMSVSLVPSIGNWNLACRSHYVVDRGRVIEAGRWSDVRIAAERRHDKAAKKRFYENFESLESPKPGAAPGGEPSPLSTPGVSDEVQRVSWSSRIRRWVFGRHGRDEA